MRWFVPTVKPEVVAELSRSLNISPLLAHLLALRGIEEPEAADIFLHPSLEAFHDPYLMADMGAAVGRIRRAIAGREKILVYGDYDVDGTMAVVVLLTAIRSLGGIVETYIPHRLLDGYGMRSPVVEQAMAEGYGVVISVDTGIREHEVIRRAQESGIDCIVTDHHVPDSTLPPACAVLNPRRSDCPYPEKNLSGVGVAFKLAQALLSGPGSGFPERAVLSYLKVVAIGTIADVVPLVGENRLIARFGLEGLSHPVHKGLEALLRAAGQDGGMVTATDVSFRIAPRLNAAGRMKSAREVIELFTTTDAARATKIAEDLEALNRERQQVEEQILNQIVESMTTRSELAERYFLVFSGEGWHRGVIGIVAQRVVERYHRPTLVIGVEQDSGQGSGRSIPPFNLIKALERSSDLFERFGGHAQAAGFTLPAERIGELERRLEAYSRTVLGPADFEPVLRIDRELGLSEVDENLYAEIGRLEPYGFGNPAPVFAARNLRLVEAPRVLKEKHLKLRVAQEGRCFDALLWRKAEQAPPLAAGQNVDLAFTLDENVYQGRTSLQLIVRDLETSRSRI